MLRHDSRHRRPTDNTRHTRRRAALCRPALERLEERLALTVELSGAPSVFEGSAYVLTLNGYDAPSQAGVTTYRVDWGDGVVNDVPAGDVIAALGQVQHTYADGALGGTDRIISVEELPSSGGGGLGLDPTFGTAGVTITDYLALNDVNVAIAQGDNHFIAFAVTADSDFSFVRYLADGSLDTSFGVDGRVVFALPDANFSPTTGLAVDEQGRILIAGTVSDETGADFAVARYDTDGELDLTFGTLGLAVIDFDSADDQATSLALDGNEILVAGQTVNASFEADIAIARLDSAGGLVESVMAGYTASGALPSDLDVASDGSIVMIATFDSGSSFVFVTFVGGTAGTPVAVDFGGMSTVFLSLALDDQDRIYIAGGDLDLAVARYDADGELDSTFGGGDGVFVVADAATDALANDVLIDDQGRIVLAGQSAAAGSSDPTDLLVARLAEQGGNDPLPLPVTVLNAAPTAYDDAYSVTEDGVLSVSAPLGVLSGDSDPAGANDALTVTLLSGPAHGTLALGPDGSFTYTPGATGDDLTSDSFTYTVSDGDGGTDVGTVSISITPAVANGTVVRTGSIVRVGGTSGNNNIVLTQSSGMLFKNGSSTGVSLTGATQIRIWGRDGDDVITLSGFSISAVVFGGAGNDVITANGGSDLLLGGDGVDVISGGNGSDLLVGGQGNDLLMAGNGNDIVAGGGLDDSTLSIDALFGILNDWALAHDSDSSLTEEVTDGSGLGDIDMLSGGNGSDWFLLGDNDVIVDSNLNPDLITHI